MSESQRIYIKNLGPIRNLEFEVKRFGLVIGESAVGKSTLAKAIYLFKNFKSKIMEYFAKLLISDTVALDKSDVLRELRISLIELFDNIYGFELKDGTFIRYEYTRDKYITLSCTGGIRTADFSSVIDELYHLLNKQSTKFKMLNKKDIREINNIDLLFVDSVSDGVNKIFEDFQNSFYIPANRSLVIDGLSCFTAYDFSELDYVLQEYLLYIRHIRKFYTRGKPNLVFEEERLGSIWSEIMKIVGGVYYTLNKKEYFLLEDHDVVIPLTSVSSGQKDILWLLHQLLYLLATKQDAYVIIEEPESHIFPSLQKKVMDIISFFANQGNNGVFVTTHSPYILLATNTLFYAGKFKTKLEEAEAIVGKDRIISEESLTAIRLTKQGAEDLIIPREHELHTSYIDASDEIHSNYNKLVDLEDGDDDSNEI